MKKLYPLCTVNHNEFLYNENSCKNENNEEVEKYTGNIYKILNQIAQDKIQDYLKNVFHTKQTNTIIRTKDKEQKVTATQLNDSYPQYLLLLQNSLEKDKTRRLE